MRVRFSKVGKRYETWTAEMAGTGYDSLAYAVRASEALPNGTSFMFVCDLGSDDRGDIEAEAGRTFKIVGRWKVLGEDET